MNIYFNNQPFETALVFIAGKTIDMSFNVYRWDISTSSWLLWDMTGMIITGKFRRMDGLLIKEITSSGGTPEITIAGSSMSIYDSGFTEANFGEYEIEVNDSGETVAIMRGYFNVLKNII